MDPLLCDGDEHKTPEPAPRLPAWIADCPYLVLSDRGFEARFSNLICAARTAAFRAVWHEDGSFRQVPLTYWVETETCGTVCSPSECRLIAGGLTPSEARLRTEAARDPRRQ